MSLVRVCDKCGGEAKETYEVKGKDKWGAKLSNIKTDDLKDLCIYCIIDGISHYDNRDRACDCDCHK